MLYSDLYTEVNLLTGGVVDNQNLLIFAANKALRDIYNDTCIEKTVRIATHGIRPSIYISKIECTNAKEQVFRIKGAAYSMRVHGTGQFAFTGGGNNRVISVDSPKEAKVIKGFYNGEGTITFWGGLSFTVYDFAMYDRLYTDSLDDIPEYTPEVTHDLRELFGDFLAFTSPAVDNSGTPIKNCRLRDGRIIVDNDFNGEIVLTYRRLPTPITTSTMDQKIDIPAEYDHLLPILAASYAVFESDKELSELLRQVYRTNMDCIRRTSYYSMDNKYIDTNGWA